MNQNPDQAPAGGEDRKEPRVSLRKIDMLLNGELDAAEAARFRKELEASPDMRAYLERQEALKSDLTWPALRRAVEADRRSGSAAFLERAREWLRAAADLVGGPRQAWSALGAVAALAFGITLWSLQSRGPETSRWTMKGASALELRLNIGGKDYGSGDLIPARAGDTLSMAYRSQDSLRAQLWFKEDDGEPQPFAREHPEGFRLPPATAWSTAAQRMIIEGNWQRQEIWMVVSRDPLDQARAAEAIKRGGGDGVRVLGFRMIPRK